MHQKTLPENVDPCSLLEGMQSGTATVVDSMEIPQETKTELP